MGKKGMEQVSKPVLMDSFYYEDPRRSIRVQYHGETIEEGPDFIPFFQLEVFTLCGCNDSAQLRGI